MKPYDLLISDSQGELGLVADWGVPNPIRRTEQQPQEKGSSVQLTAEQPYAGTDSGPPYPVQMDSFVGGMGQPSYDAPRAAYDAFLYSERLDTNTPGALHLGPRVTFAKWDGSTSLWSGGANVQTKDTVRGPAFSGVGLNLLTFTGTASQIRSLKMGSTTLTVALQDGTDGTAVTTEITGMVYGGLMRSRTTGAVFYIAVLNSATSWKVMWLNGGTGQIEPIGTVFDVWYYNAVTYTVGGDAPAALVRDYTTDGQYVYACASDSSSNGTIVYGSTASNWALWSSTTGMLSICHAGGILYGARKTASGIELGYFGAAKTWVPFASTGLLNAAATFAGMTSNNLFVYAALTDGYSHSFLMRMQHSTEDKYGQVAEFPEGFVATCCYGAAGIVYVGGYRKTGEIDETGALTVEGLVYAVLGDSAIMRVCVLNQEPGRDMRVLSIGSRGVNLLVATTSDLFRYNLEEGAASHWADITTNSVVEGIDTEGFTWDAVWAQAADPNVITYPEDATPAWTDGGNSNPVAYHVRSNVADGVYGMEMEAVATKHQDWYRDDGTSVNRTFEVHTKAVGTSVTNGQMQSQCGMFSLSNSSKVGIVRLAAVMSGGSRTIYEIAAGKWVSGTTFEWTTYAKTNLPPNTDLIIRMTISIDGFKVYLNDDLLWTLPYAELAATTGIGTLAPNRTRWGTGWWAQSTTNTLAEHGTFLYARYANSGAYPPNYAGSSSNVAYVTDVFNSAGFTYVPVPALGINIIEPYLNPASPGYLKTSASTLRQGSVKKFISHADVLHSPLYAGQSLRLGVITETGATALSEGVRLDDNTTRFDIGSSVRRVALDVEIGDTAWSRPSTQRLDVWGLTFGYVPEAQHPSYEFQLSVTSVTQGFDADASDTIDRLLALAGKTAPCSCLYGDFTAYVEQVDFVPVPSTGDYPYKQGRVRVQLRDLTT